MSENATLDLPNGNWRAIPCRNGIQWLLQKKAKDKDTWYTLSYCRTRVGLFNAIRQKGSSNTREEVAKALEDLPERID